MRHPFPKGLDADQGGGGWDGFIWKRSNQGRRKMSKSEIRSLREQVQGASGLNVGQFDQAAVLVRRVFPQMPEPRGGADLVGQLLHSVDLCLPGWTIQLTGKAQEPDGHWRCSLRETRGSDEVEIIGLGTGRVVEVALLEALLHVAEQKAVV
jgi:hypothetical protein